MKIAASYSKTTNNPNSCYQLCNSSFGNECLECKYNGCTKCKEGYFIYEGRCYENMTGCINNTRNNNITECDKCDKSKNFYCINKTRTSCEERKDPN